MNRNVFKLRALILACMAMVFAAPAMAQTVTSFQSGWFWQNPWPQQGDLYSVVTPGPQTVVAVGRHSRFMRSSDGGATWSVQSLDYNLQSVSCTDANTCTVVGLASILGNGSVGGDIGPGTGTTTHTWTNQYLYQTMAVSGANFKVAVQ